MTQQEDLPYPPELPVGAHVIFTGPDDVRRLVSLTAEHPGVVADAGEKHADVRWVARQDWFVHEGLFDPRWLRVVDEGDFAARAAALRTSPWPGFPDGAPGEHRT